MNRGAKHPEFAHSRQPQTPTRYGLISDKKAQRETAFGDQYDAYASPR